MSLTEDLRVWRKNRNIKDANTKVFVANVLEELFEIYYDNKDDIELYQKIIMEVYFDRLPLSENDTLDAIQDIQVFSVNETEQMGYDNIKCNQEVFKEINSRVQDPIQKAEWDSNGAEGKWHKDRNQDVNTLYKADYSKCKK